MRELFELLLLTSAMAFFFNASPGVAGEAEENFDENGLEISQKEAPKENEETIDSDVLKDAENVAKAECAECYKIYSAEKSRKKELKAQWAKVKEEEKAKRDYLWQGQYDAVMAIQPTSREVSLDKAQLKAELASSKQKCAEYYERYSAAQQRKKALKKQWEKAETEYWGGIDDTLEADFAAVHERMKALNMIPTKTTAPPSQQFGSGHIPEIPSVAMSPQGLNQSLQPVQQPYNPGQSLLPVQQPYNPGQSLLPVQQPYNPWQNLLPVQQPYNPGQNLLPVQQAYYQGQGAQPGPQQLYWGQGFQRGPQQGHPPQSLPQVPTQGHQAPSLPQVPTQGHQAPSVNQGYKFNYPVHLLEGNEFLRSASFTDQEIESLIESARQASLTRHVMQKWGDPLVNGVPAQPDHSSGPNFVYCKSPFDGIALPAAGHKVPHCGILRCDKLFSDWWSFSKHILNHEYSNVCGEKNCPEGFVQARHLKKHQELHLGSQKRRASREMDNENTCPQCSFSITAGARVQFAKHLAAHKKQEQLIIELYNQLIQGNGQTATARNSQAPQASVNGAPVNFNYTIPFVERESLQ